MITKLNAHDLHQVKIFQTKNSSIHSYCLRCVDCNKHIQWLGVDDARNLLDIGIDLADEKYVVPDPKYPLEYVQRYAHL